MPPKGKGKEPAGNPGPKSTPARSPGNSSRTNSQLPTPDATPALRASDKRVSMANTPSRLRNSVTARDLASGESSESSDDNGDSDDGDYQEEEEQEQEEEDQEQDDDDAQNMDVDNVETASRTRGRRTRSGRLLAIPDDTDDQSSDQGDQGDDGASGVNSDIDMVDMDTPLPFLPRRPGKRPALYIAAENALGHAKANPLDADARKQAMVAFTKWQDKYDKRTPRPRATTSASSSSSPAASSKSGTRARKRVRPNSDDAEDDDAPIVTTRAAGTLQLREYTEEEQAALLAFEEGKGTLDGVGVKTLRVIIAGRANGLKHQELKLRLREIAQREKEIKIRFRDIQTRLVNIRCGIAQLKVADAPANVIDGLTADVAKVSDRVDQLNQQIMGDEEQQGS